MHVDFLDSASTIFVCIKEQLLNNKTPLQKKIIAIALLIFTGLAVTYLMIRSYWKKTIKQNGQEVQNSTKHVTKCLDQVKKNLTDISKENNLSKSIKFDQNLFENSNEIEEETPLLLSEENAETAEPEIEEETPLLLSEENAEPTESEIEEEMPLLLSEENTELTESEIEEEILPLSTTPTSHLSSKFILGIDFFKNLTTQSQELSFQDFLDQIADFGWDQVEDHIIENKDWDQIFLNIQKEFKSKFMEMLKDLGLKLKKNGHSKGLNINNHSDMGECKMKMSEKLKENSSFIIQALFSLARLGMTEYAESFRIALIKHAGLMGDLVPESAAFDAHPRIPPNYSALDIHEDTWIKAIREGQNHYVAHYVKRREKAALKAAQDSLASLSITRSEEESYILRRNRIIELFKIGKLHIRVIEKHNLEIKGECGIYSGKWRLDWGSNLSTTLLPQAESAIKMSLFTSNNVQGILIDPDNITDAYFGNGFLSNASTGPHNFALTLKTRSDGLSINQVQAALALESAEVEMGYRRPDRTHTEIAFFRPAERNLITGLFFKMKDLNFMENLKILVDLQNTIRHDYGFFLPIFAYKNGTFQEVVVDHLTLQALDLQNQGIALRTLSEKEKLRKNTHPDEYFNLYEEINTQPQPTPQSSTAPPSIQMQQYVSKYTNFNFQEAAHFLEDLYKKIEGESVNVRLDQERNRYIQARKLNIKYGYLIIYNLLGTQYKELDKEGAYQNTKKNSETIQIFYRSPIKKNDIQPFLTKTPVYTNNGDLNLLLPDGYSKITEQNQLYYLTDEERRIKRASLVTAANITVTAKGGYQNEREKLDEKIEVTLLNTAVPQFEKYRLPTGQLEVAEFIVQTDAQTNTKPLFKEYYDQEEIPSHHDLMQIWKTIEKKLEVAKVQGKNMTKAKPALLEALREQNLLILPEDSPLALEADILLLRNGEFYLFSSFKKAMKIYFSDLVLPTIEKMRTEDKKPVYLKATNFSTEAFTTLGLKSNFQTSLKKFVVTCLLKTYEDLIKEGKFAKGTVIDFPSYRLKEIPESLKNAAQRQGVELIWSKNRDLLDFSPASSIHHTKIDPCLFQRFVLNAGNAFSFAGNEGETKSVEAMIGNNSDMRMVFNCHFNSHLFDENRYHPV